MTIFFLHSKSITIKLNSSLKYQKTMKEKEERKGKHLIHSSADYASEIRN